MIFKSDWVDKPNLIWKSFPWHHRAPQSSGKCFGWSEKRTLTSLSNHSARSFASSASSSSMRLSDAAAAAAAAAVATVDWRAAGAKDKGCGSSTEARALIKLIDLRTYCWKREGRNGGANRLPQRKSGTLFRWIGSHLCSYSGPGVWKRSFRTDGGYRIEYLAGLVSQYPCDTGLSNFLDRWFNFSITYSPSGRLLEISTRSSNK